MNNTVNTSEDISTINLTSDPDINSEIDDSIREMYDTENLIQDMVDIKTESIGSPDTDDIEISTDMSTDVNVLTTDSKSYDKYKGKIEFSCIQAVASPAECVFRLPHEPLDGLDKASL